MANSIWYKNIRGIFFAGYKSSSPIVGKNINWLSPVTFILHTVLLPLTLTIGAGIKTLIDYHTRRPLKKRVVDFSLQHVDQLQDQTVEQICQTILEQEKEQSAWSISSQRFIGTLLESEQEKQRAIHRHLAIANDEARLRLGHRHIFTVEDAAAVVQQEEKNLNAISRQTTALKKDTLKRYIASPDNNGKATYRFLIKKMCHAIQHTRLSTQPMHPVLIGVSDGFIIHVQAQIKRLRDNARWFSIGNRAKADQIQTALNNFRDDQTAENMNELKLALNRRRIGALTGSTMEHDSHTTAYKNVFRSQR